jgi:hypothetical protein
VIWAQNATGTDGEVAYGISTDPSGNSYLTGTFSSPSITFGSTTLTNTNPGLSNDVFVAKYSPLGNALWAKSAGSPNNERGEAIAIDNNGNCYITGTFRGSTFIFNNDTLFQTGISGDIFIAKIGSTSTAMQELYLNDKIRIYPNPSTHGFFIELEDRLNTEHITVEVLDLTGRLVLQQSNDTDQPFMISTESILPGVYEVRVNIHQKSVLQSKVAIVH